MQIGNGFLGHRWATKLKWRVDVNWQPKKTKQPKKKQLKLAIDWMGCKFEFRLDQSIHLYLIFFNTKNTKQPKKKQLKLVINWMGCKFEFGLDQPIHWYLILKIPKIPNNQKKKQLKLVINWMGCKFGLDQPIHWLVHRYSTPTGPNGFWCASQPLHHRTVDYRRFGPKESPRVEPNYSFSNK